ncbi:MAG: GDSL-type esterase/lipase family protein [Kiritimatiellae bacterium]|nr:GDSL-type esterase/lipase family protein [Kiritimatiellia bacterium]
MTKIKSILAFVALMLCGGAWATAIPVAYWDGFKNLTAGGYTWTNNGGTVNDDGSITIGKTDDNKAGLVLDLASNDPIRTGKTLTLVIDAVIPTLSSQAMILNIVQAGCNVSVAANGGTLYQRWGTGGNYGSASYTAGERHTYVLRYKGVSNAQGKGAYTFIDGEKVMEHSGLMTGNDSLTRLGIGCYNGKEENSAACPVGMKVYRAALYATNISDDDIKKCMYTGDYAKYSYSTILNWRGTGTTFHSQKVSDLYANGTSETDAYTFGSSGHIPWNVFADNQDAYTAPGYVLRLDSATATKAIDGQFQPWTFGGLIVEAEGCSLTPSGRNDRGVAFGDPSGKTETYMDINEDFSIVRGGSSNEQFKNGFYGTVNLTIADGKTFTYNKNQTGHELLLHKKWGFKNTAVSTTLKMHGAGTLAVATLTAEGGTLDYSDLPLNRATPFIDGNLVVDAETKYVFPAGLEANTPFQLCSGTITKNGVDVATTIRVGSEEMKVNLTYDTANGTVSYELDTVAWKPNTAKLSDDHILDWTAEDAWIDENNAVVTWPKGDDIERGLTLSAVIDAKDVGGVKISGQVKAGKVAVECSDNLPHDFEFHNNTLGVAGSSTTDADTDCLTTSVINLADFRGNLGLKVPIVGSINFSSNTHLIFRTGTAEGDASTAYGYTIVGNAAAIEVAGEGKFEVPANMYSVPFAPNATATIVYKETGDVTGAITGEGKVEVINGTVTFNVAIACGKGLAVESGKAVVANLGDGNKNKYNKPLYVASGAELEVSQGDWLAYNATTTMTIAGTLTLKARQSLGTNNAVKLENGATIDGTSTDWQGDWEYFNSNDKLTIADNATVSINRLGIRDADDAVTIHGKNSTLNLSGFYEAGKILMTDGVTIIVASGTTAKIEKAASVTSKVLDVATNDDGSKTYRFLTYAEAGMIEDNIFEGKEASYWQNIYTGPIGSEAADASVRNQWGITANAAESSIPLVNTYEPALFDGDFIPNVAETDSYKSIAMTGTWDGWQLQLGLVNGVKLTVDHLTKIQDMNNVGCFIGVDATSKLIISDFKNGNNDGEKVFDVASPNGIEFGNGISGSTSGIYKYSFHGTGETAGSILVNGEFSSGVSHEVKYVEISQAEIGTGNFKEFKTRKLISFTSSTLADTQISFASDAKVKVGDAEPSAAFAKPAGVELTAMDADGTAQIIKKDDGIYVQYVGWSNTRPEQYQWEFVPGNNARAGNWSDGDTWYGLFNHRHLTWSEEDAYIKHAATDADFVEDASAEGPHHIRMNTANDFEFFFDATRVDNVVVDTTVASTSTGTYITRTGQRKIMVVGDSKDPEHPATFKFNLPQITEGTNAGKVDSEGAPKNGIVWEDSSIANLAVPVDATSFVGELGLRAKLTGPVTLGPNAKIVFVKPAGETTVAYDYTINGLEGAAIEVRGGGEFIVPNNMSSMVPFEITAGEPNGTVNGAGYIVYNVESGTVTVNAAITGEGGVKKTGAGKLVLAGDCSFEGALEVLEGTVEMAAYDDNTRISAVNVAKDATLKIVISDDQKLTGYNASNVHVAQGGNFTIVDSNDVQQSFLNGTQIVPGTAKIWKQGVINSDFITSTPTVILYDLRLADLLSTGNYGTIVGKLSGNYINNNDPARAIDATGTIGDDTTMTVNGTEYQAKTLKIQATDGGVVKTHEIKICEIQDNDDAGLWKIWAQSVDTYNDIGNHFGADGVNYRAIMIWAKPTSPIANVNGADLATISEAITRAQDGVTEAARTITLLRACGDDLNIPEGVTIDTNGQTITGTLNGAGKIVYHGTDHNSAFPTAPTLGSNWTGIVSFTDFCTEAQYTGDNGSVQFYPNNYANENSKIEFNGVKCFVWEGEYKVKEIIVADNGNIPGLVIRNGWSNRITKFKKLSGAGTIYTTWDGSQRYRFADVSEFEGSVVLTGTAGDRRPGIIFGSSSESSQDEASGKVQILEGAVAKIAAGKTWTTPNGVVVNGVLDLASGNGSTALVTGAMTIGETGAIRIPANWAENAKFKLCGGELTAPDSLELLPIVVGDYAFKANLNYSVSDKTVAYRTGALAHPIAFWKGDFADNNVKSGVTLHANGNTIDATGVTIAEAGTKGMTLDFNTSETGIGNQVTVLVKYSGLPTPTANSVFFSFASQSFDKDLVGGYLKTDGTLGNIWNDGTDNRGTSGAKPAKSGMIAATVSLTSSGAHGAVITIKDDLTADYSAGSDGEGTLVASGQTMVGVAIGGKRNSSGFAKLVGMKIEAVAVFNGVLSKGEMESFHWGFDGEDPTLVWKGESDADISSYTNWIKDDEAQTPAPEDTVLSQFDLIFPGTTETRGITVSSDVTYGILEFNGDYTLKGNHVLSVNSVKIADGASLRLEKGVTLNFVGAISTEALSKITFAGGQITAKKVPHFTQDDDIVVDQGAYTTQGGHKLISWTDFMTVGEYGYGMPKLNSNAINPAAVLTTHTETVGELDWGNGSKARLLGMVGEIFLEVRSAEQLARKPIRILPLGDSITEGYNGSGNCANYRTQLAAKLSMAGYMVETLGYHYVRSRMPSGEWAPIEWQYHAGVSAQRVWTSKSLGDGFNNRAGDMEAIEATLNVCDGEPDIVLVKLGTNDIGNGDPANHIFDGLKKTIDTIHAKFPNAKVIVTTAVKYGTNNGIRNSYNTLIRNAFKTDGVFATSDYSWLSLVDQCVKVGNGTEEGSFNDDQGRVLFYSDSTHPDWAGHDLMSDGWYEKIITLIGVDAGKDKAPKAACTLGAKANVPAEYLDGFVRVRQLDIAEEAAYPQTAFDSYTWKSEKTVTGITKVGYFMELVRKDNGAHTFVWVDMDKFGDAIADLGLPTTTTHQQVVDKLHVYSNLGSVHNVDANDDSVKGYIEFSPFNSTCNALSGAGVPTKLWDAMDWNDTFATSGAGRGAMQVHRVKKEGDELWNGGEVIFAYNNWGSANTGRDGTKAGEIGIGNFCQHYMTDTSTNGNGHEINSLYGGGSIGLNNNQISVDYTSTRFSPVGDRVNAKAYEVMRLEIWVKGTVDSDAEDPVVITTIPEAGIEIKPDDDVKVTIPQDSTATAVAAKISVKYTDANGTTTDLKTRGYVTVAVADNGAVTVATTEAAKPEAVKIKMTLPKDKVSFTITDPIPGLFYSIVSANDPAEFDKQSGVVEDSDGTQATGGESTTTSIDMPDAKVKYFRVRVKATK